MVYAFCYQSTDNLKQKYDRIPTSQLEKRIREDIEIKEVFFVSARIIWRMSAEAKHYAQTGHSIPNGIEFSSYFYLKRRSLNKADFSNWKGFEVTRKK